MHTNPDTCVSKAYRIAEAKSKKNAHAAMQASRSDKVTKSDCCLGNKDVLLFPRQALRRDLSSSSGSTGTQIVVYCNNKSKACVREYLSVI